MRRGIAAVIGSRITAVERLRCRFRPIEVAPSPATFRRKVVGARIIGLERVGKRVAVWIDRQAAIVFEPRMSGLVLVANPPDDEHLRLRIRLEGGPVRELLYWDRRGLGGVRVYSARQFRNTFCTGKLGPDALRLSATQLRKRLGTSRRAIKVALLDQRVVAGVGNLYASEILHLARIHPATACLALNTANWKALGAAMRHVLQQAIRYEGSTLWDGTYRNALSQFGRYQNHHRVYGREGEVCPSCQQSQIVRIVQAQRSTFFCPYCQPKENDE
jgi:formamidopyrimidine-DNA glycosylase